MKSLFDCSVTERGMTDLFEGNPRSGKPGISPLFGGSSHGSSEPVELWCNDERIKELEKKAFERGYKDGWKAGFDEGKEKGIESGRKEILEALSYLRKIVDELSRARDVVFGAVCERLVDLALASAKKITKKEISLDREVVLRNIEEAVSKLDPIGRMVIRVNPEDYGYIQEIERSFFESIAQKGHINFEADGSVERGGCVVETEFGSADARIETQWKNIERALKDVGREA